MKFEPGSPQLHGALAGVFVACIFVGALMPGSAKMSLLSHFPAGLHVDKAGHVLGFLGAAFFASRARLPFLGSFKILGLAVLIAGLTELLQAFIPGRTPLATDVAIDAFGALVGIWTARSLMPGGDRT